jgi:hypothetical protein
LADPEDPQLYVVSEALLRDLEEYGIEKLEKVGLKAGRDGTTETTPLDMRISRRPSPHGARAIQRGRPFQKTGYFG